MAAEEGFDLASSKTESLEECEKLCDITKGCNSFSYATPRSNDSIEMMNCQLKDKNITSSDEMIYNETWTTYYRQCSSGKYSFLLSYAG